MNSEQYNTMIQLFANLSQLMTGEFAKVRQEMADGFAEVRQEMADGFAEADRKLEAGLATQLEISHTILNTVGESFQELETELKATTRAHNRRLKKIEHHIGLA